MKVLDYNDCYEKECFLKSCGRFRSFSPYGIFISSRKLRRTYRAIIIDDLLFCSILKFDFEFSLISMENFNSRFRDAVFQTNYSGVWWIWNALLYL